MYYTGRAVEDAVFGAGRDGHVVGDLQERPASRACVKRRRAGDPEVIDVDLVPRRKQGPSS